MADSDMGATAIHACCTICMLLPFVTILLAGELSLAETWLRILGALFTANLEAYCQAVILWLWVVLVCSAPNALSLLLTSETTVILANSVLLKHRHTVIIHNLPGLDPLMILATGSLIATNIRYLVLGQRVDWLEAKSLQKSN